MTEQKQINKQIAFHKQHARKALAAAKNARRLGLRDRAIRNLTAAAANTWLAVGAVRYVESYNAHGVRI